MRYVAVGELVLIQPVLCFLLPAPGDLDIEDIRNQNQGNFPRVHGFVLVPLSKKKKEEKKGSSVAPGFYFVNRVKYLSKF